MFLLITITLLLFYFLIYKMYIPRLSAFGCFDDCFSFAAGYFLNHQKSLYTEIFYNHQLLPAYLSAFIQNVTHPLNLFDLVLRHRQFLLVFGFIFNVILFFRFGFPALLFIIFFELSKFYIFGDRFLGESFAVYPLVYLICICWKKLKDGSVDNFDLIASSICSYLVIFLRETFIPLGLVLYIYILFPIHKMSRFKFFSVLIFLVLSLISLFKINLHAYYFNLIEVNRGFFTPTISGVMRIFFYPVFILTENRWNLFGTILAGIDILFICSLLFQLFLKRKFKFLLICIPLILSNLRAVEPGRIFYASFHMIPFFGIFLSSTFLLISEVKKYNKKIWLSLIGLTIFLLLYYVSSPQFFFREKVNPHGEFITNYGNILQSGYVIHNLSGPQDTLFVDGFDEVVYWIADRRSSYKYSMYTSLMPNFTVYSDARLQMFKNNPPDYYYGSCPKDNNIQRLMPQKSAHLYTRLKAYGQPSCIFVRKDKIKEITSRQWKKAKELGYESNE